MSPKPLQHSAAKMAAFLNDLATDDDEVEARDWAGFFKALAEFASVILPLILPLFQPKTPAN